MSTIKVTHLRNGMSILDITAKTVETHTSINSAKRMSRKLQKNGAVVRRGNWPPTAFKTQKGGVYVARGDV